MDEGPMGDPWGPRRTNREKPDSRWNSEDEVEEKWTSDLCPSESEGHESRSVFHGYHLWIRQRTVGWPCLGMSEQPLIVVI